jgi:Ca2+-binding RTX toxin-like protein
MPVIYGAQSHDLIQGAAGADTLIGGAGNDTYIIDSLEDLILEEADAFGTDAPSRAATTAAEPITLIRTAPDEYAVRIQVAGAPDGVFAEYRLNDVAGGVLGINGLRVADAAGELPTTVLANGESVWEYAFQLGRPGEDGSPTAYEWYGGGHGAQQLNTLGLMLDGVDLTALPIGTPVNGTSLSVAQDMQIMLPLDRATLAGSALLQHVFDQSGMSIRHAHAYLDGFLLSKSYTAMLPLAGADRGGIDYMQIGDGAAHEVQYDGTYHLEPGRQTYATAWGDAHNFLVRMDLPSGGPDLGGDWSRAYEAGMWLYDTTLDYAKIYLSWIAGGNHPAIASEHETHYSVSVRDIAVPVAVTPLATRAAGQGVDTIVSSIGLQLPANVEILRLTGTEHLFGLGNQLNNTLVGNAGDNYLDGAGGDDLLRGGAGNDTYVVHTLDDHVEERDGEGVDTLLTALSTQTVAPHLENLIFIGSGSFTALGNAVGNQLQGGEGDDVMRGLGGDDRLTGGAGNDTLVGGAGYDHIIGGAGQNTLLGEEGDDVIDSRGGSGVLQGGGGNDVYLVDNRAISIVEAAGGGVDEVRTASGAWVLQTGVEVLSYTGAQAFAGTGNDLSNVISGGGAGDVLNGLGGDDRLSGGDGDDRIAGGWGADVLQGGAGVDTLTYAGAAAGVDVRLHVGDTRRDGDGSSDSVREFENLIGSAFNDLLVGDGGANVLEGGAGADILLGFAGDDILRSGQGGAANQLQGGQGNDYYVLEASDTPVEFANEGVDTVEVRTSHVMRANIENLIFTGQTRFVGTGNGLDNTIVAGGKDDTLRGGGGNDRINGGLGRDELVLRGQATEYRVTSEGEGWRVLDSVSGRDGSTFVTSVELLRFGNNMTLELAPRADNWDF